MLSLSSCAGGMFLMWECSTPFVFMRWGLHTLGRTHSKLYLYNGLTMMAVFFLCRNLLGVGKLMRQPILLESKNVLCQCRHLRPLIAFCLVHSALSGD